jgi:hypothetical protein
MSVGLEVAIQKLRETDVEAEYAFMVKQGRGGLALPAPRGQPGRVSVMKQSGEVKLLAPCPDDDGDLIFSRAVAVLTRHWRAGEYPDITGWAA